MPQKLADLPHAEWLTPHDGTWGPDGDHDTVLFENLALADLAASGSRFMECAFTGVTLDGGGLRSARFLDVWAQEMRLVGTDLTETQWRDSTLIGSVFAGTRTISANLTRVVFQECKLDSVNLRDSTLVDVTFTDCLLRDVDFGGARLTRTSFPGSRLDRTVLAGATLDQVDLRGADLGITIDPHTIRGAIVSPAQLLDLAPLLAGALGIEVKEPPPS
ncbi:pentapeptide repeat-containing protein [Actinomadura rudentiformis]|uniref:Pentapeptide repeat-containing protein n=1 Tax=Actinomadura rudentiformis TaxID=359158 RepID=A0A6H9YX58_9ACTN|nr:pentapeptide repeat-containing protein [Actinomadura rudentiformis]